MSERVRNTVMASLTGSKKIIVAACAAIAMFLGAVSAGASMFVHDSESSRPTDLSAIFTPSTASDSDNSNPTQSQATDSLKQATLPASPSPLYITPITIQPKDTAKKPAVNETLKQVTNSTIFQSQVGLLNKLQGKATETINVILPTVDVPAITLPPILNNPESPADPVVTPPEIVTPPVDTSNPPLIGAQTTPADPADGND